MISNSREKELILAAVGEHSSTWWHGGTTESNMAALWDNIVQHGGTVESTVQHDVSCQAPCAVQKMNVKMMNA